MDEEPLFPPNSNVSKLQALPAARENEPSKDEITKIVTGKVIRRKKPLGHRLKELFLGGETQGIVSYLAVEILVPAIKATVADMVQQGLEKMFYGEARSTSRRTGLPPRGVQHTSYQRYSTSSSSPPWPNNRSDPRRDISRQARATHQFQEIILSTRGEANDVLEALEDRVRRYSSASVADLYHLVGITEDFTDRKWGWSDLNGSRIIRVSEGYWLSLPPTEVIDD